MCRRDIDVIPKILKETISGTDFLLQLHLFFGTTQKSCLKYFCVIKKKDN